MFDVKRKTLHGFVNKHSNEDSLKFTDEHTGYKGLKNHEAVNHSVGKWVEGMAHTNGMESFWAMMKRGYHGTYHRMSRRYLDRYFREFSERHNLRAMDTMEQMSELTAGTVCRWLMYQELTAE